MWIPFQRGMGRPQVTDGGTVAANIDLLNKQSLTVYTIGGPSARALGGGLTAFHCKELACYEMLHRASDLD
jgi:hypothetical protein